MENREGVTVDELCKRLMDNQNDNLCPHQTYNVNVFACEEVSCSSSKLQLTEHRRTQSTKSHILLLNLPAVTVQYKH